MKSRVANLLLLPVLLSMPFMASVPPHVEGSVLGLNSEFENPNAMYETDSSFQFEKSSANTFSKKFNKPIESFKIALKSPIKFEDLRLNVELDSGVKLEKLFVHEADGGFGDEETENRFSQLFVFDNYISSVTILGAKEGEVELEVISSEISKQTIKANTVDPIDSQFRDRTVKENFYKNLGFDIVTREEWGAPSTSQWKPWVVPVDKIVVHHTATSVNHENPAQTVKLIYNDHVNRCSNAECTVRWNDIGYNYLIDQYGTIYEGRVGGNGSIGAHSPPNYGTIGIGILGNYEGFKPNKATRNALQFLMAKLANLNNIDLSWQTTVFGHKDRSVTACPGKLLYEILPSLVQNANSIRLEPSKITTVSKEVDRMFNSGADVVKNTNDEIQLILERDKIDDSTFDQIENYSRGVSSVQVFNSKAIINVDPLYAEKIVAENKLILDDSVILQPNYVYERAGWDNTDPNRSIPDDYDVTEHWYIDRINAPEVWKDLGGCVSDTLCGGDPSTIVAVLDTGVAYESYNYDAGSSFVAEDVFGFNIEIPGGAANGVYNEGYDRIYSQAPELSNVNFVTPYDAVQDYFCFLRALDTAADCNAAESDKINHANDDDGHGTFVTTIIAGNTGDTDDNLVGIAHNVSIMPVDVFLPNDSSMGVNRVLSSSLFLEAGIDHAVANGADVINMSIAGGGYDQFLQDSINEAYNAGIVIVASAGNTGDGDADSMFPGVYDNIIVVGASSTTDARAAYSSYGTSIDVVAPVDSGIAGQWYSCANDDTCYREDVGNQFDAGADYTSEVTPVNVAGSSFASPQVAALAALMKSENPSIHPFDVEMTLHEQSSNGGSRNNSVGYGVIDMEAALNNVWTKPNPREVYRFYNASKGVHFYTASTSERDKVINDVATLDYEGIPFRVHRIQEFKTKPVYRFYNATNNTHFYTVSGSERDKVINTLPKYQYEGVSYYVFTELTPYTKPIYRFYNTKTGVHFYTASESEKDKIISTLPQFIFEGVAYYATR